MALSFNLLTIVKIPSTHRETHTHPAPPTLAKLQMIQPTGILNQSFFNTSCAHLHALACLQPTPSRHQTTWDMLKCRLGWEGILGAMALKGCTEGAFSHLPGCLKDSYALPSFWVRKKVISLAN